MATELFKLVGTIEIDASVATQKITAVINSGSDLEKKLKDLGENADKHIGSKSGFNAAAVWLGNTLTSLSHKVFDLGLSFAKIGWQFNESAETYKATFKSMLGLTDDGAEKLFEKMRQFAVDTPYNLQQVATSAVRLFNAGYGENEVFDTLYMLSDIAGGDSAKLDKLAKALTDTMGYGKLRAQERNQFVENGVLIYDLLSEYYSTTGRGDFSSAQLTEMQEDGGISFEDVYNALLLSTKENGNYYNRTAELMETGKGQAEKLQDQLDQTAGAVLEPFYEEAKSNVIPALTKALEDFYNWAVDNKEVLAELAEALGEFAVAAFDVFLEALKYIATNYDTVVIGIHAIAAAMSYLKMQSDKVSGVFGLIVTALSLIATYKDEIGQFFGVAPPSEAEAFFNADTALREAALAYKNMKREDYLSDAQYEGALVSKKAAVEAAYLNFVEANNAYVAGNNSGVLNVEGVDLIEETLRESRTGYVDKVKDDVLRLLEDRDAKMYRLKESEHPSGGAMSSADYVASETIKKVLNSVITDKDGVVNATMVKNLGLDYLPDFLMEILGVEKGPYDEPETRTLPSLTHMGVPSSNNNPQQTLMSSMQNVVNKINEMPDVIASAIGNITVTGHITTGDVKLNNGALVGILAPQINMRLGWQNKLSGRG